MKGFRYLLIGIYCYVFLMCLAEGQNGLPGAALSVVLIVVSWFVTRNKKQTKPDESCQSVI
jgi:hypothetical protein